MRMRSWYEIQTWSGTAKLTLFEAPALPNRGLQLIADIPTNQLPSGSKDICVRQTKRTHAWKPCRASAARTCRPFINELILASLSTGSANSVTSSP